MKLPIKGALLLGVWLTGCVVAQARIGETEKQCEERYGKAMSVSADKSALIFCKPPLLVRVHFYGGKCDWIAYIKADKSTPEIRKELTDEDRDVLHKANGGGRKWKKNSESSADTVFFETTDSELGSEYGPTDHVFIIWTREAYQRSEDELKADGEKRLKGF